MVQGTDLFVLLYYENLIRLKGCLEQAVWLYDLGNQDKNTERRRGYSQCIQSYH